MKNLLKLVIVILLTFLKVYSQQGSLMLPKNEISKVRQSLYNEPYKTLYNGIYTTTASAITQDNTSSSGRRARAGQAKNIAFVLMMNLVVQNGNLTGLSSNEKTLLEEKLFSLLENINTDIGTLINYDDWQWRCKDMQDYLTAFDFINDLVYPVNKLSKSSENLIKYVGNLYRESTKNLFGLTFFSTIKNNHALMVCGALGIGSVVLNNIKSSDPNENPVAWLNASLWNIDNLLWKDSDRKLASADSLSGYAEGMHYLKYPMLNCLPFFRMLANLNKDSTFDISFNNSVRKIRSPYYDKTFYHLWDWVKNSLQPDGKMPCIEDTFVDEGFAVMALIGNPLYNRNISNGSANLSDELQYNFDLRPEYICANVEQTFPNNSDPLFEVMPYAGSMVFRSSWDSNATYMNVTAKHGNMRTSAGGHNQSDETSFMIMHNGEILALYPGYLKYDRRNEVGNSLQRSMILVDGIGTPIGSPNNSGGSDAFISDWFDLPNINFGEINTAYGGASITRRIFFVNKQTYLISDIVNSDKPHTYTWQLQGNGLEGGDVNKTGVFINDFTKNKGTYQRKNASLQASIVSNNKLLFSSRKEKHELHYDSAIYHTTLIAETKSSNRSDFASVLNPFTGNLSDSINSFFSQTYSNNNVNSIISSNHNLLINNPNMNLFNTSVKTNYINDSIESNSDCNLIIHSKTDKTPLSFFVGNGSNFSIINQNLQFISSVKTNFYYSLSSNSGYVNKACQITLKLPFLFKLNNKLINYEGDNIDNIIILDSNSIVIKFSKKGNFKLIEKTLGIDENENSLANNFSTKYISQ